MESTKKREYYLMDLFDVEHIDDVPQPQEVIKTTLEEENFEDRKEEIKGDKCFRCGTMEDNLILVLPKVKKPERGYRHFETFKGLLYDICLDQFDGPTGGKNINRFDEYILENWDKIINLFEEEVETFKERYTDLENYITVCESCNTIIHNYNLYLCKCGKNLHPAKYDKCFECVIEERGLKLCPICRKKHYNPDKYDKCKICRS